MSLELWRSAGFIASALPICHPAPERLYTGPWWRLSGYHVKEDGAVSSPTTLDRPKPFAYHKWVRERWLPKPLRTMRRFAEAEFILPDGKFIGRKFKCARQPFSGAWFDYIDSGRFREFNLTGPSQAGKTTIGFIIPILYHLFEIVENIIVGCPDGTMVTDKWEKDILPAIMGTRFQALLPTSGLGSKGGKFKVMTFKNGARLKFVTGGGSDKSRAGYTCRVLIITETDDLDRSGVSSVEADKVTQMEARLRSFSDKKVIYKECTLSTPEGRTYRDLKNGTDTRIVRPCPKCHDFVTPERKNVRGWEDAENVLDARDNAYWNCPSCGEAWTEEERFEANSQCLLLHRGQEVVNGEDGTPEVVGDVPRTNALSFRFSAVDNSFQTAADIGEDLWKAEREHDEDNAEKFLCQFVFAEPYRSKSLSRQVLDVQAIVRRTTDLGRGMVPDWAVFLTAALDLGKFTCHFVVSAWAKNATGSIIDYGVIEVPSASLGIETGLRIAMLEFHAICTGGYPNTDGDVLTPKQAWIDAHWQGTKGHKGVQAFCREVGNKTFRPSIGCGQGHNLAAFNDPRKKSDSVKYIGNQFYRSYRKEEDVNVMMVNADHWKAYVHAQLMIPTSQPGALTLFAADPKEHTTFAKHMTAEEQVEEFTKAGGRRFRWVSVHTHNHFLDVTYNACAAASYCGASLPETVMLKRRTAKAPIGGSPKYVNSRWARRPDGSPYLSGR